MSDYNTIRVEVEDRVGVLTLSRPDRMNAFTAEMGAEMVRALEGLDRDPEVRAVVVTGEGRAFCAGADIEGGFGSIASAEHLPEPVDGVQRDTGGVLNLAIYGMDTFVVGAVNGAAVGIGFTMLLPMDTIVAAEGAKMAAPFTRRGIVFDGAASFLLPKLVGWARARDWALTGRTFRSEEAKEAGLVNELRPAADVLGRAMEVARDVAANCSPESVAINKRLLRESLEGAGPMALHMAESRELNARFVHPDCAEGVQSFFERRTPEFRGYSRAEG